MLLKINGTSGAGKSTLVRAIMSRYDRFDPVMVSDRKQPYGYVCLPKTVNGRPLFVLGHYETPCGGCDTIKTQDEIFDRVRSEHARGMDVLFEGLLIGGEFKRTLALHTDGLPFQILGLTTPLQTCLDSIQARREASGRVTEKPVSVENIRGKFETYERTLKKLENSGVPVHRLDRDAALAFALGYFGLEAAQ